MKEQELLEILEIMHRTIVKLSENKDLTIEDLKKLETSILYLRTAKNVQEENNISLEKRVSNYIAKIPTNLKGYKYVRLAIILTYKGYIGSSITKDLYPTIALEYGTTPSKVERTIRHAIEVGWNNGMGTDLSEIFPTSKGRPVNSYFISAIANDMKLNDI